MFKLFSIILFYTVFITNTSCQKIIYNSELEYNNNTHPSIILQLIEDNKHLFSINGIFETLLKLLDDVEDVFENPKTTEEVYSCGFALTKYLMGLKSASMWALKMADSTSKIQTGLLIGNFIDLGQYDECVNINVPLGHNYTFYTQHCLVDFVINLPENVSIEVDGAQVPISRLLGSNHLKLTMGQCIPSDCPSHLIQTLYNTAFLPINFFINGSGYSVRTSIAPTDCHLYERGSFTVAEWIVLMIIVIILFTVAVCTTADLVGLKELVKTTPVHPGIQMVLAFSVTRNFNKLTSTSSSAETMTALNGLKVFSILWVVLGHRYRYLMTVPIVNLMDIPNQIKNWTKMIILSAPLSVDTFFMISGLLNMYVFCNLREKKPRYTPVEWIISYVHRYIRLTPAYAMMIAITATWLYRFGNGPMWDRIMGVESKQCQTEWWQNIIYLNNYINPDTYCMMQSWYLAADMQMFWLSPLVIYPLWRWPIFGYVEIVILTIASVASPLLVSYFEGIKTPIPTTTIPDEQAKEMDELYLPTHTKTMGYVIGIFTGYLIYCFKKEKFKFRMNLFFSVVLWLASTTCMLYAIFGAYNIFQLSTEYSVSESAFYIGFYKLFWCIGLMWVIISCIMGHGGPVNAILSIKIFGPFGRLTYCIYLTHIAVILCDISSRRMTMYYTDYGQVQSFFGDVFFAVIFATILSLLLESPLMTIEKLIFGRRSTPKRARQPQIIEPVTQAGPSTISSDETINFDE